MHRNNALLNLFPKIAKQSPNKYQIENVLLFFKKQNSKIPEILIDRQKTVGEKTKTLQIGMLITLWITCG